MKKICLILCIALLTACTPNKNDTDNNQNEKDTTVLYQKADEVMQSFIAIDSDYASVTPEYSDGISATSGTHYVELSYRVREDNVILLLFTYDDLELFEINASFHVDSAEDYIETCLNLLKSQFNAELYSGLSEEILDIYLTVPIEDMGAHIKMFDETKVVFSKYDEENFIFGMANKQ